MPPSQLIIAYTSMFIPCIVTVTLTLAHFIKGCRDIYNSRKEHRIQKSLHICSITIHSVFIALYLTALPTEIINDTLDSAIKLNALWGEHNYILWGLIGTSLYIFQIIEAFAVNVKYPFLHLFIILFLFWAQWLFLITFKDITPVNCIVCGFIIVFYIPYSYMLCTAPSKVYIASIKWL